MLAALLRRGGAKKEATRDRDLDARFQPPFTDPLGMGQGPQQRLMLRTQLAMHPMNLTEQLPSESEAAVVALGLEDDDCLVRLPQGALT